MTNIEKIKKEELADDVRLSTAIRLLGIRINEIIDYLNEQEVQDDC